MDAKHTPGPWTVSAEIFDNDGQPETVIIGLDGLASVAVALDFGQNNQEMRTANARLIAAAPDLLANLRFAVSILSAIPAISGTAQVDVMRAAIAKATGAA